MAFEFRFPDVGEGIQEGEIVKWKVKEGDSVKQNQVIAEVETDKAIVELPSPKSGTILKINFKEGQRVKVGETLVVIGEKGEKVTITKGAKQEKKSTTVMGVLEEGQTDFVPKKNTSSTEKQVLATPAVRALARQMNINLTSIKGSGKDGRILEQDLKAPSKSSGAKVTKKYDMYGYVDRVPLSGIRKTIATKLSESTSIPHVTHMDEADITDLLALKEEEKSKNKKMHLTLAPFIIKAVIAALKEHPILNATLEDDQMVIKKYYNIGVATDTPEGLMVPVLKIADQKTIVQLAQELQTLVENAKKRKIDLADLKGSSFSITNIGSIGGTHFTPIINPGNVAILGIGKRQEKVALVDGEAETRFILPLSLTFDHRVMDGAEAARFMNDLKKHLEKPTF